METTFRKIWKKSEILGEINLIFVTVGTMYGFQRLIKEMDEIAKNIDEEVIMQIGDTTYEPINTKYFRFASREEMNQIYINSRVVVCHAGVGSILSAIEHMKPVIVVPRRKEYGEVVDDHQLEITREFQKEGIIKAVYDLYELKNIMKEPINSIYIKNENILAKRLKEYLNQLSNKVGVRSY